LWEACSSRNIPKFVLYAQNAACELTKWYCWSYRAWDNYAACWHLFLIIILPYSRSTNKMELPCLHCIDDNCHWWRNFVLFYPRLSMSLLALCNPTGPAFICCWWHHFCLEIDILESLPIFYHFSIFHYLNYTINDLIGQTKWPDWRLLLIYKLK
jgi:hypothetical protein